MRDIASFCLENEADAFALLNLSGDELLNKISALIEAPYTIARAWLNGLQVFLGGELYNTCLKYLTLHYFIISGDSASASAPARELYTQHKVGDKEAIVSSVSNSGSSATMQTFKSLTDGKFLMLDLNKTKYGRFVYSILESLQGAPAIIL